MTNWNGLDLNLLVVFDAVMRDRNLTRAGKRLGLSQPAVSHALARLRHTLGDELLVRGADGMVATPRAEQLAAPIRDAQAALHLALEPHGAAPADMAGRMVVAVNGYTAFALANRIVAAIHAEAPGLGLAVVPSGTLDILDQLDARAIDLALTGPLDGGDRFKTTCMLTDVDVAVMRSRHPAAEAELSLQTLAGLRHLTLTSTGDSTAFLDEALEAAGVRRTIGLSLPFLAVSEALMGSDLVVILPRRVAAVLRRSWDLIERPLPFPAPPVHLMMTWHRRVDEQPKHQWVRATVRRCVKAVERDD